MPATSMRFPLRPATLSESKAKNHMLSAGKYDGFTTPRAKDSRAPAAPPRPVVLSTCAHGRLIIRLRHIVHKPRGGEKPRLAHGLPPPSRSCSGASLSAQTMRSASAQPPGPVPRPSVRGWKPVQESSVPRGATKRIAASLTESRPARAACGAKVTVKIWKTAGCMEPGSTVAERPFTGNVATFSLWSVRKEPGASPQLVSRRQVPCQALGSNSGFWTTRRMV
mmetsp:Transcript_84699/g.272948  ORF Transcript_84699/g.272948 Transcript_84699/m.272948 type:complete len:223 (-) Transcript_84699:1241-1909(-)